MSNYKFYTRKYDIVFKAVY